jgi:hypothetical protein
MMSDLKTKKPNTSPEKRLHLLSKELEEATNLFLTKLAQLEKLLPEVNE